MNHYTLQHRQSQHDIKTLGVFHEPSEPITLARYAASNDCTYQECYEEKVSAGQEIFRATYGLEGECFLVEKVPCRRHAPEPGGPAVSPRSPERAKTFLLECLAQLFDGDWELVDMLVEREVIVREVEGSPFLGKLPGPNAFYSLHFRLNESARALLNVSKDDRARVRETLKDQG